MYVSVCVCVWISVCLDECVSVYECVCVWMSVCVSVCACMCVHV